MRADELHRQGLAAYQAGRVAEAAELLQRAAALAPGDPGLANNLGIVLAGLGRQAEAVASYDRAVALQPDFVAGWSNRGNALRDLGRLEQALASHQRALALQPAHADALSNRGLVLADLGRLEDALASHERAVALRPDLAAAHLNRGNVLRDLGRLAEALASYDRVIALAPGSAQAQCNRGVTLMLLGRPEEALAALDRAVALAPGFSEAWSNLAALQLRLGRVEPALASAERALALRPDHFDALLNRSLALKDLHRGAEALAGLDRALALRPDDPTAQMHKAILLLQQGRYAEAWPGYEVRWRVPDFSSPARGFAQPQWRGEALAGRTLLLHAEQGFGDTIQFSRYAKLIAGGRVVLQVPTALRALLAPLAADVIGQSEPPPAFDLHCPLLSLPLAFGTTLANIPVAPYLRADPERVALWAPRLPAGGRRVGLAWAGNRRFAADERRSPPLAALLPLVQSGATLVSLQKEMRDADRATLAAAPIAPLGPAFADFADTAAVIAQLDLVIAADTAVAHLAAALGKPTWVLLPYAADWRWLLDRADSPWYPTARLFRQSTPGDWHGVIGHVRQALAGL